MVITRSNSTHCTNHRDDDEERLPSRVDGGGRRRVLVVAKKRSCRRRTTRRRLVAGLERRSVRALKKLIPNGDVCRETADYITGLEMRVRLMKIMVQLLSDG
ncbi:hypothetical protein LINGRAHAP2_LOCUS15932 [Linum grandiflorum]